MNKTDFIELNTSKKISSDILNAINSSIKTLSYLQRKFYNNLELDDDILLVKEEALLLSKLLEYTEELCILEINNILDKNYADKKTALDLIEIYSKKSKRYKFHSRMLKKRANKCIGLII